MNFAGQLISDHNKPASQRGNKSMTAINAVTDLSREGDIAVVTINSPPVNALSADVRNGLRDGVGQAAADPAVKATVVICAGRTFIAGADIAEFGKPPKGATLPELQSTLEGGPKPIIAAVHGTALGGGFEMALMCHYRVAVPSAKFGLPEIKLGLMPGAGGTQRLPRLSGVENALETILSGNPFSAKDALDWGVVDTLAEEGKLREGALAFARKVIDAHMPLRKIRDLNDKIEAARGKPEIFDKVRREYARKYRGFEAWQSAMRAVQAAVDLPFDEGIKLERQLFLDLIPSAQSRAQRYVFFAERKVWKIADVPEDTPVLPVKKVGVIGAGTMGGGISMNFLNAGIPVTIVETAQEALDRGLATIRRNYDNSAKKGRLTLADVTTRMGLLGPGLNLDALSDCDLIIEAVYENMDIKKDIFRKLDKIAKPGAILASNTSYLNIDEIAAVTGRPDHVLGMHFFSPANVMRLLEVVRGVKTAKPVIATAMQLARKIGKIGVLVGVCHGFVGNRMLAQRQREAQKLIIEGAMPWDVDRVIYDFGMPMGPFAMSDLAGLDIGWSKETSKSSTVREILCEMDRRGQKTGAGFYDYDEARNAKPSPVVEKIILDFAAKKGINRRTISDEEILQRCIYPMINEGAKILEEGKAQRASDIDIVWINGYGWPVYRGGPMFYADLIGSENVLATMKKFEATMGDDFKPASLLESVAAEKKRFQDLQPAPPQ
jgi:3-hydroxyacyl-CoA dehydrogenase